MERPTPVHLLLTVLAYVFATFAVQGASHFAINADHYATIPFMRDEPIVAMGLTAMVIQGVIFALLFPRIHRGGSAVRDALILSWAIGGFLTSYIVLAEAGKYAVPSTAAWLAVEVGAAFVQFTLFGVLLGLVHRRATLRSPAPQTV